jgi:hypothetical protein
VKGAIAQNTIKDVQYYLEVTAFNVFQFMLLFVISKTVYREAFEIALFLFFLL